jgi:hypothetical protein
MLVPLVEIDGIAVCFGTKKAPQKYGASRKYVEVL